MPLYAPLLKSCTTLKSLLQIHAHILASGRARNPLLSTNLIESYSNLNKMAYARSIFNTFDSPDAFMLGVMLKNYVWYHHFQEAIFLYNQNPSSGSFVITPVLQACSSTHNIAMGRKIHSRSVKVGFGFDSMVQTALLQMYGQFLNLDDASKMFDEMLVRDVVVFSLMISSCVLCGKSYEGLRMFSSINFEKMEFDSVLIISVLEACADLGLLKEAKSVHGHLLRVWKEPDEKISQSLVKTYLHCHGYEYSEKLFENVLEKSLNICSAMIACYNLHTRYPEALNVFIRMMKYNNAEIDLITIKSIVYSCMQLNLVKEGKSIHGFCVRRFLDPSFDFLGSSFISMYSSFQKIETCFYLFEDTKEKSILSWNSIIAASTHNAHPENSIKLFLQFLNEGMLPDSFTLSITLTACAHTYNDLLGTQIHCTVTKIGVFHNTFVHNSLIDMYCKCKWIHLAFKVFDQINLRSIVTWNAMIGGALECSSPERAIEIFEQAYNHAIDMDIITYMHAIKACTCLTSLTLGRIIHSKLITSSLDNDSYIDASLTNMYAKCSDIETARLIFDNALDKNNVGLWNVMISGYGHNTKVKEAISLFEEIVRLGVRPNGGTFVAILSACGHGGLVDEGLNFFDLMKEKFGLEQELDHYVCVVDMLSRDGQIGRAYEFIMGMKIEPDACVWRALLRNCQIHQKK